jgi:hypothetical protein
MIRLLVGGGNKTGSRHPEYMNIPFLRRGEFHGVEGEEACKCEQEFRE